MLSFLIFVLPTIWDIDGKKRIGENQEYDLVEIRFPEVGLPHKLQFLPSAEACIQVMNSDPVIKARLENKTNFVNRPFKVPSFVFA